MVRHLTFLAALTLGFAPAACAAGSFDDQPDPAAEHGMGPGFTRLASVGHDARDDGLDISPSGARVAFIECRDRPCLDHALVVVDDQGRTIARDESQRAWRWYDPSFIDEDALVVYQRSSGLRRQKGEAVVLNITDDGAFEAVAETPITHWYDFSAAGIDGETVIVATEPENDRIVAKTPDGEIIYALDAFPHEFDQWLRVGDGLIWFTVFMDKDGRRFVDAYDGPAHLFGAADTTGPPYGYSVSGFLTFGPDAAERMARINARLIEIWATTPAESAAERAAIESGNPPKSWNRVWDVDAAGEVLVSGRRGLYVIDRDAETARLIVPATDSAGVAVIDTSAIALSEESGRIAVLHREGVAGWRSVWVSARP